MPFTITLDHHRRLVLIAMTGMLDLGIALEMATTARAVAHEHVYDLIYDLRAAQTVVSISGLFQFPDQLMRRSDNWDTQCLVAHLISSTDRLDDWVLYERAANRVGIRTKLFYEPVAAWAWIEAERAEDARMQRRPRGVKLPSDAGAA